MCVCVTVYGLASGFKCEAVSLGDILRLLDIRPSGPCTSPSCLERRGRRSAESAITSSIAATAAAAPSTGSTSRHRALNSNRCGEVCGAERRSACSRGSDAQQTDSDCNPRRVPAAGRARNQKSRMSPVIARRSLLMQDTRGSSRRNLGPRWFPLGGCQRASLMPTGRLFHSV
jgi:hypothetical protein